MGAITTAHKEYLETAYGPRVNFDKLERKLYGYDVGDIPRLIKPLVGDTTFDGVVQPESEKELVELVNWARANRVALTPRGMATSGYLRCTLLCDGSIQPAAFGLPVSTASSFSQATICPYSSTSCLEYRT